jgi:hypothetical protein
MKKIELRTPFGVWEIAEVKEYVLKFTHLKSGDSFTLESSPSFPACSASSLTAFAKIHNHKFPSKTQFEILHYLFYHGLYEWITKERISFNLRSTTYITDEVLETTLYNPYGDDFTIRKFVCYNIEEDEIKAIDGEQKLRYMIVR